MSNKHSSMIKEITDIVLLSSISGGNAEHNTGTSDGNGGGGNGGGGGDALHSAWANIESGILAMEGYNCGFDHVYGNGHSFTGFGGHC